MFYFPFVTLADIIVLCSPQCLKRSQLSYLLGRIVAAFLFCFQNFYYNVLVWWKFLGKFKHFIYLASISWTCGVVV